MDGEIRDLLVERMNRLEARLERLEQAQAGTNAHLEEVTDVLRGLTSILLAMKDGQERVVDRLDRLAESITRGFTLRDDRLDRHEETLADLKRRITQAERELRERPI
jgi:chromosome segregation ATPase